MAGPMLGDAERALLEGARTATLATIASDGRPRLVPVCFVVERTAAAEPTLWTPIDEKPKRSAEPRELERVRDIVADPRVTLLVDRWDEDWSRLGWLRLDGRAMLVDPGADRDARDRAIGMLRAKYPQYAGHRLEALPLIRIGIERIRSWGQLSD